MGTNKTKLQQKSAFSSHRIKNEQHNKTKNVYSITTLPQPHSRDTVPPRPTHPCQLSGEPRPPCYQTLSLQTYPLTVMVSKMEPQLSIPTGSKEALLNTQNSGDHMGSQDFFLHLDVTRYPSPLKRQKRHLAESHDFYHQQAKMRLPLPYCPHGVSGDHLGRNN